MSTEKKSSEYSLSPGVVILSTSDLKGEIIEYNEAFKEASGYSDDEIKGQSHNLIRHPDMPKEAFKDLWQTVQAGYPWFGIVKNKRKNGQYYWVAANVSPIKQAGEVTGYVSVRFMASDPQKQKAQRLYQQVKQGRLSFPYTRLASLRRVMATSDELIQELKSQDMLPQLPAALIELQSALNDPRVRNCDLEQIIVKDPMLTLEIVKISNSLKYKQGLRIKSLAEAISRLGMSEVENIAYQVGMSGFHMKSNVINIQDFMENAIFSGYIAQKLANKVTCSINPNLAFICGIFHDIGVLLMAAYDDEGLDIVKQENNQNMGKVIENERAFYGVLHPALGGTMLREWGLQREVVMGVAGHHVPTKFKGVDGDYAKLTFLAELGSRYKGKGYGYFSVQEVELDQALSVLSYFNMTLSDYTDLLDQAEKDYNGSVA
jgi:PAS domain S-box-containing protein